MLRLFTTRVVLDQPTSRSLSAHLKKGSQDGFWLDLEAPGEEDLKLLESVFGFHPLTIEDIRHQNQRPKLEEYKDYAFLVLFQGVLDAKKKLTFRELHVFLAPDYVVTVHDEPSPTLDTLRDRLQASPDLVKKSTGLLAYTVLDAIVDSLFPVLEQMDERIDALENRIISRPDGPLMAQITSLKHQVIQLRRYLGAERDVFQRLVTHSLDLHDQELTLYWRDVYDHLIRQYETVDSLRDLLSNATDVYLSTISNRLNNTMKALTVIASLFLPLTFLTGFYGMNFTFLTQTLETPRNAFFVGVGTMLVSIAIQFYYFRRRGWL